MRGIEPVGNYAIKIIVEGRTRYGIVFDGIFEENVCAQNVKMNRCGIISLHFVIFFPSPHSAFPTEAYKCAIRNRYFVLNEMVSRALRCRKNPNSPSTVHILSCAFLYSNFFQFAALAL